MSLRTINKKINETQRKIQFSTQRILQNKDSPLFCDECESRLGLIRSIRYAFRKKPKETYYVLCKNCNYVNMRIKGEAGKNIDQFWDQHGV